jgi:hypothetical protein
MSTEQTKYEYIFMSQHHNTGRNYNIYKNNKSLKNGVAKYLYLETTVTSQN